MDNKELLSFAAQAMRQAYAPYSDFFVGAAVEAENIAGERAIFVGCNIENAAFSPTMCAERVAIAEAVKNGYTKLVKIAVCGGKNGEITDYCPPCGVCRQVISEFGNKDTEIVLSNGTDIKIYTLEEILPLSFSL